MTATNPWIPLFITNQNFTATEPEVDAKHFWGKAMTAIDSAKNEITFGETLMEMLLANENGLKECHRSLATICVWHFECAVELFNKAIRNFEKAQKHGLSRNEKGVALAQIEDCKYQLNLVRVQTESATELLNSIKN